MTCRRLLAFHAGLVALDTRVLQADVAPLST